MIELIKDIIFTITHPRTWIMLNTYSKHYDEYILRLIDNNTLFISDSHTSTFVSHGKKYQIWTSNFPYAYGRPYFPFEQRIRPSRRTIYKLRNHILSKQYS